MAPSFVASVPLLLLGLSIVSADYPNPNPECKPDSCLQSLENPQFKTSAFAFCTTYVTVTETDPIPVASDDTRALSIPIIDMESPDLPFFLDVCEFKPAAVSSACSCLIASQTSSLPSPTAYAEGYPHPAETTPAAAYPYPTQADAYPMEAYPTESYPTDTTSSEAYPTATTSSDAYATSTDSGSETTSYGYPSSSTSTAPESYPTTYGYGYSNSSATSSDSGSYATTSGSGYSNSSTSTATGSYATTSGSGYSNSSTSTASGSQTTSYGYTNSVTSTASGSQSTSYGNGYYNSSSTSVESSTIYPTMSSGGNVTSHMPMTYGYSTSTIRTISYETITSCQPTVTDCPAQSSSYVVTHTIDVSTTVCPETAKPYVTEAPSYANNAYPTPSVPVTYPSGTDNTPAPPAGYPAKEPKPVQPPYVIFPVDLLPQTYTIQPLPSLITISIPVGTPAGSNPDDYATGQPSYSASNTPREVGSGAGMVSAQWTAFFVGIFAALFL